VTETPRTAVVIPCFNDGLLAREAVASVIEDEPIEIVVVNDGSTDPSSVAALSELEQAGTRVLWLDNGGVAHARTLGMQATSAPYVFPLDSDDLLCAGSLGSLADALDAHPVAAFAFGDYLIFGDYDGRYRAPARFDAWALTYANHYPIGSLIRRNALEAVGGWDLADGYEDWDLWLKLAEAGYDGVNGGIVVYRRRLHDDLRGLARMRRNHAHLCDLIRERHAPLYARRSELRQESGVGLARRLAYPLLLGNRRRFLPIRLDEWLKRQMFTRGLRP